MTETDLSLNDAAALLDLVLGNQGSIDTVFDLSKLPRKLMEIERKYRLRRNGSVDMAMVEFLSKLSPFLLREDVTIKRFTTFVGIDQYYLLTKNGSEFHFRYRLGANRPPELTVKYQITRGSNEVRGEITLKVRYTSPQAIQAFMAVVVGLADSCELFSVQQSGNIWILDDPDVGAVEVVMYKTDRLGETKQVEGFVEIEPLNSARPEDALKTIARYEEALGLVGNECEQSVAEIFRK